MPTAGKKNTIFLQKKWGKVRFESRTCKIKAGKKRERGWTKGKRQ